MSVKPAIPIPTTSPAEIGPVTCRPVSDLSLSEKADEYGDLHLRVQQFKPISDRYEALRKSIQQDCEAIPADQPAALQGRRWEIRISPKSNESTIVSIASVKRAMKAEDFWALVTKALNRALGAIKEAVGEDRYAKLVTTDRTGYRRLTPVAKSAPSEPQALKAA